MSLFRPLKKVKSIELIFQGLDRSLQRWGRYKFPKYETLQPLVDLRLECVERGAAIAVAHTPGQRAVNNRDRQHAAWSLFKGALDRIKPGPAELLPVQNQALLEVYVNGWPRGLPVPQETYNYLVLYLSYVAKTHDNKQLAALFGCSERSIAEIRKEALKEISAELLHLEALCSSLQQPAAETSSSQ